MPRPFWEESLKFVSHLTTGSPVMSGYYGVRRSFLSDSDFHNSKSFSNDIYTSSVTKPFPCESTAGQSHGALLESCLAEPYGDHRPPALTPTPGSLFSASPLPPLLPPPFPGDPTHFVFVSMLNPHPGNSGKSGFLGIWPRTQAWQPG